MKPVALIKYIDFGAELSYLRSCFPGSRVHSEDGIITNMNRFIQFVEESEFNVTKKSLWELLSMKERLDNSPKDYVYNRKDQDQLFKIMDRLLFVIRSEASLHYAFIISEKRIDINKLLFNIGSLFAKDVYDSLPLLIQGDFKEGGRCIAFVLPTSAAYNILRGVEGLLRTLLKKLDPQADVSIPLGPVIKSLRDLNNSNLSTLLDSCDRIRDNHRNPTFHPEKVYNIDEVQDLFNLCVGVVNDIITFMNNIPQPPLSQDS
ncbi:hypothetical protein LCGC14_0761990 [marine sediment metagenome]|uniref:Uncharacterized protein n=1 Tax=marine sediment metagenome TaxID=412755 RepID=A0A0F9T7V9_9ZZZZ|nr:hypothetical protein [bacterium]